MSCRRVLAPLAFAAAMMLTACADPPDKEIQQAQGAIDTARAAGADQYATDELKAAEEALKRAHDAVTERDYRLALNHALDARDRAQTAAKESVNRKATARGDATRALEQATAAQTTAQAKLKAAETAHVSARALKGARLAAASGDGSLQKARAAMERSDYPAAIESANAATARLQAVARDLEAAAAGGPRRRR